MRCFFIIIILNFCLFQNIQAETKPTKRKFNENVPAELIYKMELWITSHKPGVVMDFAGGKLYRIDEGARFVDALGVTVVIPKEKADYNYIAFKSPALARYWADKYKFKPLPPDNEHDLTTDTDDKISFFDSLNRAMAKIETDEKEVRAKITSHPAAIKDFSCVTYEGNAEIKTLCDQIMKLGMDHQQLFKKIEKLKGDLDAKSKNDLEISGESKKFDREFSPFIFVHH